MNVRSDWESAVRVLEDLELLPKIEPSAEELRNEHFKN
jgi:hypothetical protein